MTGVAQVRFLLRPPSQYTSWQLACALATSRRPPHHEQQLRDIEGELAVARGKSKDEIAAMLDLVRLAVGILNPVAMGTAASNGEVYQVVADLDDIEWAIEIAMKKNAIGSEELKRIHGLIQRHMD